jgi:uncharacterized repeat protein (TIGR03803 family)
LGVLAIAQGQTKEMVLHNFEPLSMGQTPNSDVIRDSAGNLYGTTSNGGAGNAGVVYKVDAAGHGTVLHNFTGGADGGQPFGGVIRDAVGNLYGTTDYGGATGYGAVFKLDAAGRETVLYSFTGGNDGAAPMSGLILDLEGNLYGTTLFGGLGTGTVYKVDRTGHETVLYSFAGGNDGATPYAGVVRDPAGNIYGVTWGGGSWNSGTVYKVDTAGHETVLYNFTGRTDGANPRTSAIRDLAGNLYGTTVAGGTGQAGVIYKVDAAGNYTVLYNFPAGSDQWSPWAGGAGVIRDSAGNLYGTTYSGGTANFGVVYKLDTNGGYTVLYNFTGRPDGANPQAGVIRDSAGNLYGTTLGGGAWNAGTVYQLDTAGHERVLYGFVSGRDGAGPDASVIRDPEGNLYGTTYGGGAADAGVVYKLDATGHETVLYAFTGGLDGASPHSGVIRDSAGNLYGTTPWGGNTDVMGTAGLVYKLDPTGHQTVLYFFTGGTDGGGADGANPYAGVIRDSEGNLYGTTMDGGTAHNGVIYKLDPAGQETVLYTFTGGADGGQTYTGVIRDSEGNLYGTTQSGTGNLGVIYKLDPAGQFTILYTFTGSNAACSGVTRDSQGNLYGVACSTASAAGTGVVYKLDAAGLLTLLYSFTGGSDGGNPRAGVIRDAAGNLYGTTSSGGAANAGVVYKLEATGNYTVLHSFTGGADGGSPFAGVILGPAGNLYGTTWSGGKRGGGVVFKLKLPPTAP